MKYCLDKKKFKQRLIELGYKNYTGFAQKNKIHRNTIQNLLQGKDVFSSSFGKIVSKLGTEPMELIIPHASFVSKTKDIDELRPMIAWLIKQNKNMAVILVGSRAKNKSRKYSDWDLGIFSYPDAITGSEYLLYKRTVEEMSEDMVCLVDLINLNQAPTWFLEGIQDGVVFLDGNKQSYAYLKGVIDGIQKKQVA